MMVHSVSPRSPRIQPEPPPHSKREEQGRVLALSELFNPPPIEEEEKSEEGVNPIRNLIRSFAEGVRITAILTVLAKRDAFQKEKYRVALEEFKELQKSSSGELEDRALVSKIQALTCRLSKEELKEVLATCRKEVFFSSLKKFKEEQSETLAAEIQALTEELSAEERNEVFRKYLDFKEGPLLGDNSFCSFFSPTS